MMSSFILHQTEGHRKDADPTRWDFQEAYLVVSSVMGQGARGAGMPSTHASLTFAQGVRKQRFHWYLARL